MGNMEYAVYENRTRDNGHVRIHKVTCGCVNQNGGTNPNSNVKQSYKYFATLAQAQSYASTIPIKDNCLCKKCF